MSEKHVLIVDDEEDMVRILDYNLKQEGFQTSTAMTAHDALSLAIQEPIPNIILLDLMLPDLSGMEVCRRLREQEETRMIPIIMLTAKGEEIDRVIGFQSGADDYVTKPFFIRELIMRLKAVLRRTEELPTFASSTTLSPPIVFGVMTMNCTTHQVWVNEQKISLTPLEFRLLEWLFIRKGVVQTREDLLANIWDEPHKIQLKTVNVHINRLREKLGSAGKYIETMHGIGYCFRINCS